MFLLLLEAILGVLLFLRSATPDEEVDPVFTEFSIL